MQHIFHPFPRLPIELRTKIWQLALDERNNIVEVHTDGCEVIHTTLPHVVFHTCQESRGEALRLFTGISLPGPLQSQIVIYFVPERDTLYFTAPQKYSSARRNLYSFHLLIQFFNHIPDTDKAKIQSLAVDIYLYRRIDWVKLVPRVPAGKFTWVFRLLTQPQSNVPRGFTAPTSPDASRMALLFKTRFQELVRHYQLNEPNFEVVCMEGDIDFDFESSLYIMARRIEGRRNPVVS